MTPEFSRLRWLGVWWEIRFTQHLTILNTLAYDSGTRHAAQRSWLEAPERDNNTQRNTHGGWHTMNAITARVRDALDILAVVWPNGSDKPSVTGVRWLYSAGGAPAFLAYCERAARAPEHLQPLVREIFALEAEIAARREGWCPELEPQPSHDTD